MKIYCSISSQACQQCSQHANTIHMTRCGCVFFCIKNKTSKRRLKNKKSEFKSKNKNIGCANKPRSYAISGNQVFVTYHQKDRIQNPGYYYHALNHLHTSKMFKKCNQLAHVIVVYFFRFFFCYCVSVLPVLYIYIIFFSIWSQNVFQM